MNRRPTLRVLAFVGLVAAFAPSVAGASSIYRITFAGEYFGTTTEAIRNGDEVAGRFFFVAKLLPRTIVNPQNTVYNEKGRVLEATLSINGMLQSVGNPADPFNLFSQINDHLPTSTYPFDQVYFGITVASGIRMNVVFEAPNTTLTGRGAYPSRLGRDPWIPSVRVVDFIKGPPLGDLTLASTTVLEIPEQSTCLLLMIGFLGSVLIRHQLGQCVRRSGAN